MFIQVFFFFLSQIEQIGNNRLLKKDGIAPVATGNWGCGSTSRGDVQLKLVIQWMAASLAGLPVLVYYTSGHQKLAKVCICLLFSIEVHSSASYFFLIHESSMRNNLKKISILNPNLPFLIQLQLDTVCRVLLDRKWTVGELAAATLDYAKDILDYDDKTNDATVDNAVEQCFFEKLIGI